MTASTDLNCAHCQQQFSSTDLIPVGDYPVCRTCLESLSSEVGTPRRRRIRKIRDGKQIAGVCGGLADYANMDRDTFRTLSIIAAIPTGLFPLPIIYLILAFALPEEP